MPITLQDVAKKAGVSRFTASVVLSNKIGGRISASTCQRVRDAAESLGYHPNAVASSLRSRKTNIIGYYSSYPFNALRDPFMGAIVHGLYRGAALGGKRLMLNLTAPEITPEEAFREITSGFVDGVIVHCRENDPVAALLAKAEFPAVAIVDATPLLPSVTVDEAQAASLTLDHLQARGHQDILHRRTHSPFVSVQSRSEALLAAAGARGMSVQTLWENGANGPADFVVPSWDATAAEAAVLADPAHRPTAFVGLTDFAARQVLDYCRRVGIRVPQDFGIFGFNGLDYPNQHERLTTINADWDAVAETAVALLSGLLAGRPAPPITLLPVELIEGDTT